MFPTDTVKKKRSKLETDVSTYQLERGGGWEGRMIERRGRRGKREKVKNQKVNQREREEGAEERLKIKRVIYFF